MGENIQGSCVRLWGGIILGATLSITLRALIKTHLENKKSDILRQK